MNRDVNRDLCTDQGCPELMDKHHHVQLSGNSGFGNPTPIEGVHTGPMLACSRPECEFVVQMSAMRPAPAGRKGLLTEQDRCLREGCGVPGAHHHLHQGPEDVELHDGLMSRCNNERCKTTTETLLRLNAGDSFAEILVNERVGGVQADLMRQADEIANWWVNTAVKDAAKTVPKAVEYGAVDFDTMGLAMIALVKDKFAGADDAELMRAGREMAALFYLNGKIGRALGAFAQGVMPSDDTLFDIAVYAMMWRRIRETGSWIQ